MVGQHTIRCPDNRIIPRLRFPDLLSQSGDDVLGGRLSTIERSDDTPGCQVGYFIGSGPNSLVVSTLPDVGYRRTGYRFPEAAPAPCPMTCSKNLGSRPGMFRRGPCLRCWRRARNRGSRPPAPPTPPTPPPAPRSPPAPGATAGPPAPGPVGRVVGRTGLGGTSLLGSLTIGAVMPSAALTGGL